MAYLVNMPETCKSRATNPEYPLTLLDSIQKEFQKSLDGGIFDATYVLTKLDTLTRHVEWLEQMAREERQKDYEPEPEPDQCPTCLSVGNEHDLGCNFLEG